MKKIKENTHTTKLVEIEMYQTEDGRKFSKEEDAIKHEEHLNKRKAIGDKYQMTKIDPDDYGFDYCNLLSSKAFYIKELDKETKEDLIFLYPYLGYQKSMLAPDVIKPGWNIFIEEEYDSCSISKWGGYNLFIYSANDLITRKEKEIERLKNL